MILRILSVLMLLAFALVSTQQPIEQNIPSTTETKESVANEIKVVAEEIKKGIETTKSEKEALSKEIDRRNAIQKEESSLYKEILSRLKKKKSVSTKTKVVDKADTLHKLVKDSTCIEYKSRFLAKKKCERYEYFLKVNLESNNTK